MNSSLVRTVCVMAALQAAATGQGWTTANAAGPARFSHAMAYDTLRARTVLFGGRPNTASSATVGDTWEWSGSTWTQAATTGPAAREGHSLAFDVFRQRTVLFGGNTGSGNLGDTWEWDGTTWLQVASSGPPARYEHAMAYDSQRGKIVLFGGATISGPVADTWEWDGSAWVPQLFATGPGARYRHAMVYDSLRGRTVLFGGAIATPSGLYGDLWEWDGVAWVQRASGPTARSDHAMAYDNQRGKTLVYGGGSPNLVNDTWEWDGNDWAVLSQFSSLNPGPRWLHAVAFDAARGCTVLFGGTQGIQAIGDTWEWTGAPGSASAFGSGCGNPVLTLSAVASAAPTIGTTAEASLSNIPSSLAFVAIGWSRTTFGPFALPLPLAGYGMPGCDLLQSADAAGQPVTFIGPGTATFRLRVPNWSSLIYVRVYLQGWALAPGANLGNTIVSNGVEWTVGF